MLTEQSVRSSTASSSSAASLDPDISPPATPRSDSTPGLPASPSPHLDNTIPEPLRSNAPSYSPHRVGLNLVAPRAHKSPFSPFGRDMVGQLHGRSSPVLDTNAAEQTSQQFGANVLHAAQVQPANALNDMASQPPPSPSLTYMEASSEHSTYESQPLGAAEQRPRSPGPGLRIAIPPPHHPGNPFVPSHATSSPPLQGSPSGHHAETLVSPVQSTSAGLDLDQELQPPLPPNPNDPSLNLDFAEFDSDGLSTLEKIYLFSRSRAGFQRVFIAHALPGYLRHRRSAAAEQEPPDEQNQSNEEADEISPAEAVEYVLPLLNGLAMDEDEAVKEALAAELVPIIWWFITHCRLVEDDGNGAEFAAHSSGDQTEISVQAFTPILGTLLLSPNGLVGGPARVAVVELLNRVRRADARERRQSDQPGASQVGAEQAHRSAAGDNAAETSIDPQDEEEQDYSPTGLFGSVERRLFEREMVQQVVIGMGRLDLAEEAAPYPSEAPDEDGLRTPHVPTPIVHPAVNQTGGEPTSYFPAVGLIQQANTARSSPLRTSLPLPNESLQRSQPVPSPPASDDASPASILSLPSLTSADSPSSSHQGSSPSLVDPITPPTLPSADQAAVYSAQGQSFSPRLSPRLTNREDIHAPEEWSSSSIIRTFSPRPMSPRLRSSPTHRTASPSPLSPRPPSPRPPTPPPPEITATHSPMQQAGLEPALIPVDAHAPLIPEIVSPTPERASGLLQNLQDSMGVDVTAMQQDAAAEGAGVDDETQMNEEASVGRLSSMSLMAAVTASGSIDDETKAAFVAEVERVGRDPVYWVRREASFAVGALAKVVPQEVVLLSLLPLFQSLCRDASWHVRHSALFALPAILSRLSPPQRRALALDVVRALAHDDSQLVRSGVLEALAEVIYTFHEDPDGPPDELLRLFLGVREPGDTHGTAEQNAEEPPPPSPPATSMSWSEFVSSMGMRQAQDYDIYDDPSRPLVCAFNYPAVALTLGRDRWHEIRELYLRLAKDPSFKVRRTLAASLGEMARIIGPTQAKDDLMPVWWLSVHSDDSEVRLKAVECLETFVAALGTAERAQVLKGINTDVWPRLKNWREREMLMKSLGKLVSIDGLDEAVLRGLLRKGLQDTVASVREESVTALSALASAWSSCPKSLEVLWDMLRTLAISPSYRHRMTFLSSYQTVLLALKDVALLSDAFVKTLQTLSRDPIVDVRIRLARFLGTLLAGFPEMPASVSMAVKEMARHLADDSSSDVKAFAQPLLSKSSSQNSRRRETTEVAKRAAIFSRPPPLAPS